MLDPVIRHAEEPTYCASDQIDFWGAGFDVAEKMGIVPELRRRGCVLTEARAVNRDGRRVASFKPEVTMESVQRYVSLARSDLAAAIYEALGGAVKLILGDTVRELTDVGDRVRVMFQSGSTRDFDLIIGADGLHSRVRKLAFGPDQDFEKYLGMVVAAFEADRYPKRDELVARTELAGLFALTGPLAELDSGDADAFWSVLEDYYLQLMRALTASPQLAALLRGWAAASKNPAFQAAQGEFERASLPWIEQALAAGKRVGAVRDDLPSTLLIAVVIGMGEAMDLWLMSQKPDDETLPELIRTLTSMIRAAVTE